MCEPRFFGLLGNKISYSLSPYLFNSVFRRRKLPYSYQAFDILPKNLKGFVSSINLIGLFGINVTIPYKQKILKFIDEFDKTAISVGSVNLVLNNNCILKGFNTDLFGVKCTIEYHMNLQLKNKTIAVIGAGGSARAVLEYLRDKKPAKVQLFNRSRKNRNKIREDFKDLLEIKAYHISRLNDEIENNSVHLIVNATPISTVSLLGHLPSDTHIFDLVYHPDKNPYKGNRRCCDGKFMLAAQASKSLSLMCGIDEPVEKIYKDIKRIQK